MRETLKERGEAKLGFILHDVRCACAVKHLVCIVFAVVHASDVTIGEHERRLPESPPQTTAELVKEPRTGAGGMHKGAMTDHNDIGLHAGRGSNNLLHRCTEEDLLEVNLPDVTLVGCKRVNHRHIEALLSHGRRREEQTRVHKVGVINEIAGKAQRRIQEHDAHVSIS